MIFELFSNFYKVLSNLTGSFVTFHLRPIIGESISPEKEYFKKSKSDTVAILIQGPLLTDCNFTIETIKLYSRIFASEQIIVSLWEDENDRDVEKIKSLNRVYVILNKKPKIPGIQHINYQIVTSSSGAKFAQKLGCKYLLKTRTDQRIYSPIAIHFLLALLKQFPLKSRGKQKQRIIATSLYTFKYRLYSISDMLLFGNIEDMVVYLSPKLDFRNIQLSYKNLKELSQLKLGEMYFVTNFLESNGVNLKWTIEQYWRECASRFCICDKESLDLFWYKYDIFREYKFKSYNRETNSAIMYFADWLALLSFFPESKSVPEKNLGLSFADDILE